MNKTPGYLIALVTLLLCGPVGGAWGISPERLIEVLADPEADRLVVIDIRNRAKFESGHVPGSLHIPAVGLEGRRLPAFGRVAVIWDGIDSAEAGRALAALNSNEGIEAELVDGGFPAWSGVGGQHGGAAGLETAALPTISYDELLKVANDPDLVVVDVRETGNEPLTNLSALLPGAAILAPQARDRRAMRESLRSREGLDGQGVRERGAPDWLKRQTISDTAFYVIIDNGEGRIAERVARRMVARGHGRVFMLLGGERILQAGGQPSIVTQTGSGEDSP